MQHHGRRRIRAANSARSAQLRRGLGVVLRSTATSWRRTSSSMSLDDDARGAASASSIAGRRSGKAGVATHLDLARLSIAAAHRLGADFWNPTGKYLLSTSDPDLSAEDVALGYKNLLEAERGFRDLKSTIELRPVFHRLEPRIRAHVLLCWLALLLIRVAERRTGMTWRHIARELGRLHAITRLGQPGPWSKPPNPAPPRRAFFGPAGSPRHPGSPPSTPAELRKHPYSAATRAWTHAHTVAARPFPQVMSAMRPPRLPTNCGTRGSSTRPISRSPDAGCTCTGGRSTSTDRVIDVLASPKRDLPRPTVLRPALNATRRPTEVTTDRAPAYPRVLDEVVPEAWHVVEQYANNPIEANHGRLKARTRPMRGLKRLRCAQVICSGHAFSRTYAAATTNSDTTSSPAAGSRRSSPNSHSQSEPGAGGVKPTFLPQRNSAAHMTSDLARRAARARWSR